MNRVRILVEGETEESFVNEILSPYLIDFEVYAYAFLFREKGGSFNYQRIRREILNSLKKDRSLICTTMVDYYGMPKDWPGRTVSQSCQNYKDKAQTIEHELLDDIVVQMGNSWNPEQFIPYVQMHEFEALLFSDITILAENNFRLLCISKVFSNPEEINDNYETCPSRRIKQQLENYNKRVDGIIAAQKIGLKKMREKCPHFNEWIGKLENLGDL